MGRLRIQSPTFGFNVRIMWEWIVAPIVPLAIFLLWLWNRTATLKGRLSVRGAGAPEVVQLRPPVRSFSSSSLKTDTGDVAFTLEAQRLFLLRKRVKLHLSAGSIKLKNQRVVAPHSIALRPAGQNTIVIDVGGRQLTIDMTLRI
jgi:hypothetical protein